MREALRHLTPRGRAFVIAGAVTLLASVVLGQRDILRVAILLLILPVLSAGLVARTRYRLASARGLRPNRVTVDGTAVAMVRLENISRFRSGLLLVEDQVPWQLGRDQRFVVDRLDGNSRRDVRYELRAPLRGRYQLGPMQVKLVDPFGLCRMTRRFTTTDTLTVVPHAMDLPAVPLGGDWSGLGEARSRAVASSGEDDVVPREYRTGDELRRVHWKSTARSGELMVRREEQPWRTRATVILDTRASAHRGDGLASSFEWAVQAAASIGVHLARRGYSLRSVDQDGTALGARDTGRVSMEALSGAAAEGSLLDALATVELSKTKVPGLVEAMARERTRDGLVVAVLGDCDDGHAAALSRLRTGNAIAIALVIDVSQWPGVRSNPVDRSRVQRTCAHLVAAGWRVIACAPGDDLPTLWRSVARGRSKNLTPTASS